MGTPRGPLVAPRTSPQEGSRVVVELVGPAGAGKSTLARSALEADPSIQGMSLWGLPRGPLLASGLALMPTVIWAALRRRTLQKKEITYMVCLEALRRVLSRHAGASGRDLILLDEGPVYALSWLDLQLNGRKPEAWMRRAIERWARLLHGVILVDAPDTTLAHRIRTRTKRHRMRNGSDAAISRFAGGFRRAFARIVTELRRRHGRLAVESLRTESRIEANTPRLLTLLNRQRHGR